MSELSELKKELRAKSNPKKAKLLQGFFKTGKGEYGEGDVFLGVIVPESRKIARQYASLNLADAIKLLHSKIHEERLTALLIMINKFQAGKERAKVYHLYLKNIKYINNWDLVDLSAPNIVGEYLLDKDRGILYELAKSENVWKRRIAVLAALRFIKNNQFYDSLEIAKRLLSDEHDLIQKAVGWMLREIGKRDLKTAERFLKEYGKQMPRTMLRYAIEKFPERKRKRYLVKLNYEDFC